MNLSKCILTEHNRASESFSVVGDIFYCRVRDINKISLLYPTRNGSSLTGVNQPRFVFCSPVEKYRRAVSSRRA